MEPILWLILLAVFLVIEAITAGLTTIWFAGGALICAILAYFNVEIMIQIVVFFVVSLLMLIFTRPLAVRYMNQKVEKTNVDSLIGKTAVVVQSIDNLAQTGQVKINDVEWMARTKDNRIKIPEKTIVEIEEVQGVKLIVKEFKEV